MRKLNDIKRYVNKFEDFWYLYNFTQQIIFIDLFYLRNYQKDNF